MKLADSVSFLRLEARCFGMRYNRNSLYYWRPILDYCWAYKAVQEETIVGGVIAMPTRQGLVYINSLFVDPRVRGLGIGSRLLEKVLGISAPGFILDVKSGKRYLIEMYQRHGFKVVRRERNYYLDGSERIIMRR
ncbi:MAG: GNAT family N-acetyltransferase [Nitrososphaerales archaeon]